MVWKWGKARTSVQRCQKHTAAVGCCVVHVCVLAPPCCCMHVFGVACSRSDGQVFYCGAPPSEGVVASFKAREDCQIMGREILSIALGRFLSERRSRLACVFVSGISSFAELISGRNVVIWSHNTGAEAITKKGIARTFGHCCLALALWKRFAELQLGAWVKRVPTEVNIADDQSRYIVHLGFGSMHSALPLVLFACAREDYFLLGNMHGSKRMEAKSDQVFREPQTWDSLSVVNRSGTKRKWA